MSDKIKKLITIKNILGVLGLIGFGFTMWSFAMFSVGGMLMTSMLDDLNSGNYTAFNHAVTITNPPTQEETKIYTHIASPILHIAPFAAFFGLMIMFFYILVFTKFDKPKFNNPLKKSSWMRPKGDKPCNE